MTERTPTRKVRVRVTRTLNEVIPDYQPKVGGVYTAQYCESVQSKPGRQLSRTPICIITVKDKQICLRKGEYEILEEGDRYD